jgi:hypothetical protein
LALKYPFEALLPALAAKRVQATQLEQHKKAPHRILEMLQEIPPVQHRSQRPDQAAQPHAFVPSPQSRNPPQKIITRCRQWKKMRAMSRVAPLTPDPELDLPGELAATARRSASSCALLPGWKHMKSPPICMIFAPTITGSCGEF